jgi:NAD(P)H-flavin reductase
MGYPVLDKRCIGPQTWLFKVQAPMVAHGRQPGQFFMAQPSEHSERIPLTLAGGSREEGWIRFVAQEVGCTSKAIAALNVGEELFAVAGPMGAPTKFPSQGTVVLVAGGDLITGGATVILAMGQGRRAAAAMHEFLSGAKATGPGVTVER